MLRWPISRSVSLSSPLRVMSTVSSKQNHHKAWLSASLFCFLCWNKFIKCPHKGNQRKNTKKLVYCISILSLPRYCPPDMIEYFSRTEACACSQGKGCQIQPWWSQTKNSLCLHYIFCCFWTSQSSVYLQPVFSFDSTFSLHAHSLPVHVCFLSSHSMLLFCCVGQLCFLAADRFLSWGS